MGDKRVAPVTEMFKAAIARGEAYYQKVKRGEIENPIKYDENGNIIPLPSCLEPHPIRDLNLSEGMEDLGGE